jgi:hypothetical protein
VTERAPRPPVKVYAGAWRILQWLPGAEHPDEWATAESLTEHMTSLYGPRLGRDVTHLLSVLRRAGYAVQTRDTSGTTHWRRTPTGDAESARHTAEHGAL